MHSWPRILLGGLLVLAVAAAGIALNFAFLGLTQNAGDPVGKLSPRAVFDRGSAATTSSGTTTPSTTTGDGANDGRTPGVDD